jgi:hypothetical protein
VIKFLENRGERKKKTRKVIKNSVPVLPEAQTLDTYAFEYGIYRNSKSSIKIPSLTTALFSKANP